MSDLLLVEQGDREAALAFGAAIGRIRHARHGHAIRTGLWDHTIEVQAFAAHRIAAERAQPVTVAPLYGYEAGLVEGFKQGIDAAAKVVDQRRDMILNGLSSAAAMAVVDAMPDAIRALSPPSIADEVDGNAGESG